MSYQMFLSQQVKRNVIITNKHGKYWLTDELPNNAKLKKNENMKMKVFPLPARNYLKLDTKLFP